MIDKIILRIAKLYDIIPDNIKYRRLAKISCKIEYHPWGAKKIRHVAIFDNMKYWKTSNPPLTLFTIIINNNIYNSQSDFKDFQVTACETAPNMQARL